MPLSPGTPPPPRRAPQQTSVAGAHAASAPASHAEGATAEGATADGGDPAATWKATVAAASSLKAEAALAAFGWFAHPDDTKGFDYATQGVGCVEVEVDVEVEVVCVHVKVQVQVHEQVQVEVQEQHLILSVSHFSRLRYSRLLARIARSITKGNGWR